MIFRDRLLSTLRAVESVLGEPGVMVAGSQVPNLLEPGARSSLVVSQDVDIVIPIEKHEAVRQRLSRMVDLEPSIEEPSVWLPKRPELIEVNFIGMDTGPRSGETYVLLGPALINRIQPEHPVAAAATESDARPGTSSRAPGEPHATTRTVGAEMTAAQTERVRRMRERAAIRSWEYRQRAHSKGVWFRLRRVLVDAASAFAINEDDADRLEARGVVALPIGQELSPAKRMFIIEREQLGELEATELPVRLSSEFLGAPAIVLIPHAAVGTSGRRDDTFGSSP